MSESEESVVSTKRTYGSGKDIFGKYDPDKLVEALLIIPLTKMKKIQRMKMKKKKKKTKTRKTKRKMMFLERRKSIKFDHGMS